MGSHNEKTTALYEHFGYDASTVAKAIRDGRVTLTEEEMHRAKTVRNGDVRQLMEECSRFGIQIITLESEAYPELLRQIHNPPIVLFVQGDVNALSSNAALAVVGTRNPTRYGIDKARQICTGIAEVGITIVSGLAVGIDSVAHQCAVNMKSGTVGVLACGSLVDYPAASHNLKLDIIRNSGAIVSELLPHTSTSADYFKHRNRIISGLANGTFIVEAPEKSGCALTAEHAVEQNRDLFCMPPHDVSDKRFTGTVPYLRDGAVPVFSHIDIIRYYQDELEKNLYEEND